MCVRFWMQQGWRRMKSPCGRSMRPSALLYWPTWRCWTLTLQRSTSTVELCRWDTLLGKQLKGTHTDFWMSSRMWPGWREQKYFRLAFLRKNRAKMRNKGFCFLKISPVFPLNSFLCMAEIYFCFMIIQNWFNRAENKRPTNKYIYICSLYSDQTGSAKGHIVKNNNSRYLTAVQLSNFFCTLQTFY